MTGHERTHIASATIEPGTTLNGIFAIDEKLAAGGMGEVYRGHNITTGDPVAIKVVLREFAKDETIVGLFFKEAKILNSLHHPAIVRYSVFSVDPAIKRPYMVMEFLDGLSLADVIDGKPMALEDTKHLVSRLASGLDTAHRAGVIHRDISPDNVILADGKVSGAKIIDFGIARASNVGSGTLLGGKFAGKYNFVSPEQLGLFGGEVTDASDIYSLGLLTVNALRGTPIDMNGSQFEVIEKRRSLPDISDVDAELRPVLELMLQPNPTDRTLTMADIAEWLAPAVNRARTTRPPTALPKMPVSDLPASEILPAIQQPKSSSPPEADAFAADWPDPNEITKPPADENEAAWQQERTVVAMPQASVPSVLQETFSESPDTAWVDQKSTSPLHQAATIIASSAASPAKSQSWEDEQSPNASSADSDPISSIKIAPRAERDPLPASASTNLPPDMPEPPKKSTAALIIVAVVVLLAIGVGATVVMHDFSAPGNDKSNGNNASPSLTPEVKSAASTKPTTEKANPSPSPAIGADKNQLAVSNDAETVAPSLPALVPAIAAARTTPSTPTQSPDATTSANQQPSDNSKQESSPSAGSEVAINVPRPNVTSTAASMGEFGDKLDWLQKFNGGECFYARPLNTAADSMDIEGMSKDTGSFQTLESDFKTRFGYEPNIQVRPIVESQCGIANFLKALSQTRLPTIKVALDSDRVKSGQSLSGSVDALSRPNTVLYLIDDDGFVYQIDQFMKRENDKGRLNLKLVELATRQPLAQVVLALSSDKPIKGSALAKPAKNQMLFPKLLQSIQEEKLDIDFGFAFFLLGGD